MEIGVGEKKCDNKDCVRGREQRNREKILRQTEREREREREIEIAREKEVEREKVEKKKHCRRGDWNAKCGCVGPEKEESQKHFEVA
ncbi:MAG: hypothetical protein ACK4UV_12170, partial [Ignavibacterium sp.]